MLFYHRPTEIISVLQVIIHTDCMQKINFLTHTSVMVQLFSDKHASFEEKDNRFLQLERALQYFISWKLNAPSPKEFLSNKALV